MVALFLFGPRQGSSDVHTSVDGIVKLWDTSPPGSEILDPDTNCQYAQDNSCYPSVLGQRVVLSSVPSTVKKMRGKKKLNSAKLKVYCNGQALDLCKRPKYSFKHLQYKLPFGESLLITLYLFFSTLVWSSPKKNPPEGKHLQNWVMDPVCCHAEMKMSCRTAKSVPPAAKSVTNSAKV